MVWNSVKSEKMPVSQRDVSRQDSSLNEGVNQLSIPVFRKRTIGRTIGEAHEHLANIHIHRVRLRRRWHELTSLLIQELETLMGVLKQERKRAITTNVSINSTTLFSDFEERSYLQSV